MTKRRSAPSPVARLNRLLKQAQQNPLVMIAWGLFALSFSYVWARETTYDREAAELRSAQTNMSNLQRELEESRAMVDLWRRTLNDVGRRHGAFIQSLGEERFAPDAIDRTTTELIDETMARRRELAEAIARINNAYVGNPALQELRTKLLGDIVGYDGTLERSVTFLQTTQRDLGKANEQVPELVRRAFDDQRRALEAEGRETLIEQTYDRTRKEFNAAVQVFNERRGRAGYSVLAVAAWTYIGAWIGGAGGWFLWRRRTAAR